VIAELLTSNVFWQLVTLGVTTLVAHFSRKSAQTSRYTAIARLGVLAARDVASGGAKKWQDIALLAMRSVVELAPTVPGVGALSEREIEAVKKDVVSEAKRLGSYTNGSP
jgi:hypothetical protein